MINSRVLIATLLLFAITATTVVIAKNSRIRIEASENTITKSIELLDFNAIEVLGIPDVNYTQGELSGVIVCSENLLEYLEVYVSNKTLYVRTKDSDRVSLSGEIKMEVNVSSPNLNRAKVIGIGDINIKGSLNTTDNVVFNVTGTGDIECNKIECADLDLSVVGVGDIEINQLVCDRLTSSVVGIGDIEVRAMVSNSTAATVSGTGDIKLIGKTTNATYKVAGTGDIEAHNLVAEIVDARTSGTGSISCYAAKSLTARASIASSIKYKGNPDTLDLGSNIKPL